MYMGFAVVVVVGGADGGPVVGGMLVIDGELKVAGA